MCYVFSISISRVNNSGGIGIKVILWNLYNKSIFIISMQKSLSIGILFIALTSVAQKPQQMNLDIGAPDFRSLELQTFNAVNDLRLQKKLVPLAWEDVLHRAAKDHASYLINEKKLMHDQRIKEKGSPSLRVKVHGGLSYTRIGENLVSVWLGVVVNVKGRRLSTQSYHSAANTMAQIWKASPKHYRNILNKGFNTTSVAVAYDPTSQRLVAVQVFGFTPQQLNASEHPDHSEALLTLPERKLPFGLKESKLFSSKDRKATTSFLRLNSFNGTLVGSYNTGKRAFKGRRSGIAIESIPLAQFDSKALDYHLARNRRNGLFPLNGDLHEPVYRREMLKFSRQNSPRKVYLNLRIFKIYKRGKVFFFPTDAGAAGTNLFLIRKRKLITYVTPLALPAELFEEPMPALKFQNSFSDDPVKQQFKQVTKYDTLGIKVFYPLGIASIDTITTQQIIRTVQNIRAKIVTVGAWSYASVDGDMSQNHELAKQRVNFFMSVVKPYLDTVGIVPLVSSKEQWDLFLTQIKKHNLAHLKNVHRRELRNYANAHKNDSLISSLLAEQRFTLFKVVTRHDTLIPLPVVRAIDNYWRQKKKFESSNTKTASQAAVLEQAQLKAYGEMISKNGADRIEIIESDRYPAFKYHELMFRYLVRGDATDEEFYAKLHALGQSKYLSTGLRKQLVFNNLVFIYKKYGNERHIWQMLDKDRLFCRLYRKSQFLARYKKSLQCWRDERLASDSYYMLKEFPQLIILSRRASAQHSDSLAKYYTTSMIHALYHPTLPKEIFSHVEKVSMLYHRNDKVLSVKARVKLALFYCAFRKFDDAKSLLAPEVDNAKPDPEAQKLFMTLQASAFKDQHDYIKYLIGEYPKLGRHEWCSIWTEGRYLSYLLLEDHTLKNFYNCNCQSQNEKGN